MKKIYIFLLLINATQLFGSITETITENENEIIYSSPQNNTPKKVKELTPEGRKQENKKRCLKCYLCCCVKVSCYLKK